MSINNRVFRDDIHEHYDNCTSFFAVADRNHNGFVGMSEAIKYFAMTDAFGFTGSARDIYRANQINCSVCVENSTLYYL